MTEMNEEAMQRLAFMAQFLTTTEDVVWVMRMNEDKVAATCSHSDRWMMENDIGDFGELRDGT